MGPNIFSLMFLWGDKSKVLSVLMILLDWWHKSSHLLRSSRSDNEEGYTMSLEGEGVTSSFFEMKLEGKEEDWNEEVSKEDEINQMNL